MTSKNARHQHVVLVGLNGGGEDRLLPSWLFKSSRFFWASYLRINTSVCGFLSVKTLCPGAGDLRDIIQPAQSLSIVLHDFLEF
jgi:hypothetical protein